MSALPPLYISIRDAAGQLGVSPSTVRRYMRRGLESMLPQGWTIVPVICDLNGSVDDNVLAITEAQARVIQAARAHDWSAVREAADRMIQHASTIKQEVSQ